MNDEEFIAAMLTDYNTVAEFYDNPEEFVSRQQLSAPLRKALLADDERDLSEVGIGTDLFTIAMSGKHMTGGYCLAMVAEDYEGTALGQWAADTNGARAEMA